MQATTSAGPVSGAGKPKSSLGGQTVYVMLFAVSIAHLLNDAIQSVIPAMYPILKDGLALSYTQIGAIGLVQNITASVMQPVVGLYSDRKPTPFLLPLGMISSLFGMLGLALAPNFAVVLLSVTLVGLGSAVFHPEASRVAYMAAGPRRGLAQSIFQVGGNSGQALAPVFMAVIFLHLGLGQKGAGWFTAVAAAASIVLVYVAFWYRDTLRVTQRVKKSAAAPVYSPERKKTIRNAMLLLIVLVFARSWYSASISSYLPFYLMDHFHLSLEATQWYFLFPFLAFGAAGTFFGGPLADRFGRKTIIWFSMLGTAPLALLMPYVPAAAAAVICSVMGFILLSSFSVTVVYAQELAPGRVGTVSGLMIGFAFGMGALGGLAIGALMDLWGSVTVMRIVSFLPLLGVLTYFLPSDRKLKELAQAEQI
jgi:FSR family fosmidomycin resistance protein-like MFS transporter